MEVGHWLPDIVLLFTRNVSSSFFDTIASFADTLNTMRPTTSSIAAVALGLATSALATDPKVPCLDVPACPKKSSIHYDRSVPDLTSFPLTEVSACYGDTTLSLDLTAYGEKYFYYNHSQGINGDIWEYEVMEAFIYKGTDDPQTYLEFEVNPGNVTFQSFVYNPSMVRATGAPFDHFFIDYPQIDGFTAATQVDRAKHMWKSEVQIPLALFNVKNGEAKGTQWRMGFFRTITNPHIYPNQTLGAWSPPDEANFHMTPYLGHVNFV